MTSATTATPRESQPWFAAIFDVACGTQTLFGIQASMESARADSCHAHENLSIFPVACHTLTEARLGWQSEEEEESRVAELQSSRWGSADPHVELWPGRLQVRHADVASESEWPESGP